MLFYFAKNTINGGGGNVSQFWTQIGSWSFEWYEVPAKSTCFFLLFDSLHPIKNLSDIKGQVYLGWTSAKLGFMCFAQGHNAVTPVSLEPAAPRSRVKHSTTEPLHQQITEDPNLKLRNTTDIFIKMSVIHLWCNNASSLLILCAL